MILYKIIKNKKGTFFTNIVPLLSKLASFIHIESLKTPNPNFLKFVPSGKNILGDKGTLDISAPEYSSISPLA